MVELGRGITGKVTGILIGKDGKKYAVVATSKGKVNVAIRDSMNRMLSPKGARAIGEASGRSYDPEKIGVPITKLDVSKIKVTNRGIDVVVKHIGRFGDDTANRVMVERLRKIAMGETELTIQYLNFYSHELREYVRYRELSHEAGSGDNYDLWNDTHIATLEDYGITEGMNPNPLYHNEAAEAAKKAGEW